MSEQIFRHAVNTAIQNLTRLLDTEEVRESFATAIGWIQQSIRGGKKLLICGNGGSAADAQHMAAELVGRFSLERRAIPAIALTTDTSILTSIANDYSYEEVFRRQVEALGKEGDVLIGISTSGSSKNIFNAFQEARKRGIRTILFTGEQKKEIAGISDLVFCVPSSETPRIQEMHLLLEHTLCEVVEKAIVHG